MTIQINLEPNLEKELLHQAQVKGMGIDELIITTLKGYLKSSSFYNKESILLQKINEGFSANFWENYHQLITLRQDEKITSEDLNKLIEMTNKMEAANAERLAYLSELAQLRQVSLLQLMNDLGLKSPEYVA